MSETKIHVLDVGTLPYGQALALQHELLAAKKRGEKRDFLIIVEHPPVVTVGRGGAEGNLRVGRAALGSRGVEVFDVERGGDVTYHGPGQLVGYPILDLKRAGLGVHEYLRLLEGALIAALEALGVATWRREGLTGVWSGGGKVAAIGVAVSRWISYHGFAVNVKSAISGFNLIIPCGLAGERVTSIEALMGRPVEMGAVKREVLGALAAALDAEVAAGGEGLPVGGVTR